MILMNAQIHVNGNRFQIQVVIRPKYIDPGRRITELALAQGRKGGTSPSRSMMVSKFGPAMVILYSDSDL